MGGIEFAWRAEVEDREVAELTAAHGGKPTLGWWDRIRPHSLGWVTVRRDDGGLIGFANVAWDGGDHAFLLDPKVHPDEQHRGIGTELVARCAWNAKRAGCEWLHVDFDEPLSTFYFGACGFQPTPAGLIHLLSLEAG